MLINKKEKFLKLIIIIIIIYNMLNKDNTKLAFIKAQFDLNILIL